MRDYGKVHSTFWTSETIRNLSDDGKMLALYLLTGPHTNLIGVFRLPDGYITSDLNWSSQRVSKGFSELFRNGFATRENETGWGLIHRYLKFNPLENPNQVKSAIKQFEQIPSTSPIKNLTAEYFNKYKPEFKKETTETKQLLNHLETLLKPFLNGFETLSEPLGNPFETSNSNSNSNSNRSEGDADASNSLPPKKAFGQSGNVKLTEEEHGRLCQDFTPEATVKAIQFLDDDIGSKGKDKYKSHYHALRKWVYGAVAEQERKLGYSGNGRASPGKLLDGLPPEAAAFSIHGQTAMKNMMNAFKDMED